MTQWQPIETAPKDGTRFIAWCQYEDEPIVVQWATRGAPYKFEGWTSGWLTSGCYDVGYEDRNYVKWWQPMLDPPPKG